MCSCQTGFQGPRCQYGEYFAITSRLFTHKAPCRVGRLRHL